MFLKRYRYQQNRQSDATLDSTFSPNTFKYGTQNQITTRTTALTSTLTTNRSNKQLLQSQSQKDLNSKIKSIKRTNLIANNSTILNQTSSNILITRTLKTQQQNPIQKKQAIQKQKQLKLQSSQSTSNLSYRYQTPQNNNQQITSLSQKQYQNKRNIQNHIGTTNNNIAESLRQGKKSQIVKTLDLIIEEENKHSINKPRQSINQSSTKYDREKLFQNKRGGFGNLTINFSNSQAQLLDYQYYNSNQQNQSHQKYNTLLTMIPSTKRNQDFQRGRSLGCLAYDSFKTVDIKNQTIGLSERLSQTLNSQDRASATRGGIGRITNIKPHSSSPMSINARNLSTQRKKDLSIVSLTDNLKSTNSQLQDTKKSLQNYIKKYKLLDLELDKLNQTRQQQLFRFETVRTQLSNISEYIAHHYDLIKHIQNVKQLESQQMLILDQFLQEIQKTIRDKQRIIPIQVLVNPIHYVPKIMEALQIKIHHKENFCQEKNNVFQQFDNQDLFNLINSWIQVKLEYNEIKKELLATKNKLINHRQQRDTTLKKMLDQDKQIKQLTRQKSVQIKRLNISIQNEKSQLENSQLNQSKLDKSASQILQNQQLLQTHLQNPTIIAKSNDKQFFNLLYEKSNNQTPNKQINISKIIQNIQDNSTSRIHPNQNFSNDSSQLLLQQQLQQDQSKSINTKQLQDDISQIIPTNNINNCDQNQQTPKNISINDDQTPRNNQIIQSDPKLKSLQSHSLASRSMYLQHRQSTTDRDRNLFKTQSKMKSKDRNNSIDQSQSVDRNNKQNLMQNSSSKFLSPLQMIMTDNESQSYNSTKDINRGHFICNKPFFMQEQYISNHTQIKNNIFAITQQYLNQSKPLNLNSITPEYISYTEALKPVPKMQNDYDDEEDYDDYQARDSKLEIELISQGEQIKLQNLLSQNNHQSRNLNNNIDVQTPNKAKNYTINLSKYSAINDDYYPGDYSQQKSQFIDSDQQLKREDQQNNSSQLYLNSKHRHSQQALIFRTQQPQSKSSQKDKLKLTQQQIDNNLLIQQQQPFHSQINKASYITNITTNDNTNSYLYNTQMIPQTLNVQYDFQHDNSSQSNAYLMNTNRNIIVLDQQQHQQNANIQQQPFIIGEEDLEEAPSERSERDVINHNSKIMNTTYTSVCFKKQLPALCCYKYQDNNDGNDYIDNDGIIKNENQQYRFAKKYSMKELRPVVQQRNFKYK